MVKIGHFDHKTSFDRAFFAHESCLKSPNENESKFDIYSKKNQFSQIYYYYTRSKIDQYGVFRPKIIKSYSNCKTEA
jgi:hypothetical protein